nr:uncharacterized protein LOC106731403 [Pelodiscus sinensis]|eukprot:XP_014424750.1 uncharacterized protein LOC106731403 [Pelodiscus sinensis]
MPSRCRLSMPSMTSCTRGSSACRMWMQSWLASLPWGSPTAGEPWMGLTSPSMPRNIDQPISSTAKGTSPWCSRPLWTALVASQTSVWGCFGRAHDAHILRNSSLYLRVEASTFFPQWELTVGDVHMPLCIVGVMAYPHILWLMWPYTGCMEPWWEHFNHHLNRAHNQFECAFRRLKVILLSAYPSRNGLAEHHGGCGSMLSAAQHSGADRGGLPPRVDGRRGLGI